MSSPSRLLFTSRESLDEDEALVQQCLLGNERAWSSLIRKYANLIFSVPIKRGFSKDDASDIFQSVCVALVGSLASVRDPRALVAWLIQTAAHACDRVQSQRRRWTNVELEEEQTLDSQHTPDELVRELEREQIVREAVKAMGADCQKLIRLLFFSDPPIPYEIAAVELGLAKGSMGATRMRCLERLRRVLEDKGF